MGILPHSLPNHIYQTLTTVYRLKIPTPINRNKQVKIKQCREGELSQSLCLDDSTSLEYYYYY